MNNLVTKLKDDTEVCIHPPKNTDSLSIIEYFNIIGGETDLLTYGPNELNISVENHSKSIDKINNSDNSLILIAKLNEKIIGYLSFYGQSLNRTRHSGQMNVSVLKQYWGLGLGSELMNCLIKWAQTSKFISKINLRVHEKNKRAQNLYKKHGFVQEGTISNEYFDGTQYFSDIWMGLNVLRADD